MIVADEPRILMSDSLKDSFDDEQEFDNKTIGTVAFMASDNSSHLLSIFREIERKKSSIKFTVDCRCSDAYSILNRMEDISYDLVVIEYSENFYKIDLKEKKLSKFKMKSINNEDQTCVCEIKFVSKIQQVP